MAILTHPERAFHGSQAALTAIEPHLKRIADHESGLVLADAGTLKKARDSGHAPTEDRRRRRTMETEGVRAHGGNPTTAGMAKHT